MALSMTVAGYGRRRQSRVSKKSFTKSSGRAINFVPDLASRRHITVLRRGAFRPKYHQKQTSHRFDAISAPNLRFYECSAPLWVHAPNILGYTGLRKHLNGCLIVFVRKGASVALCATEQRVPCSILGGCMYFHNPHCV